MTTMASHSLHVRPGGLRSLLLSDHNDRLELMLEEVLLERQLGHGKLGQAIWRRFKKELLTHLEAEERWLLPTFKLAHPHDGEQVDAIHAELRALVEKVEQECAIDPRSCHALLALEKKLRAHAAHEDRHLYPWSVEHLDNGPWKAIRAAMRALMFHVSPNQKEDEP